VKILSPVDSSSEVEILIENGADELYGGYVPDFWEKKFGPVVSINRRSYREASIRDFREFDAVLEKCWKKDVPFFLALNAPQFPEEDYDTIIDFARECIKLGVSGFIVSDPALLLRFSRENLGVEIHASTLLNTFSLATVKFLEKLGVNRVILPRELSIREMCDLAARSGRVRLEAIVLRGKCPNIEGVCGHLHDDPNRCWPCEMKYSKSWNGQFDGTLVRETFKSISEWEDLDRYYSCGICAVPILEKRGIYTGKIVGRGAETERKVRAIRMVRKIKELCGDEPDLDRCVGIGRSIYVEEFGFPCQRKNCYFPELFDGQAI